MTGREAETIGDIMHQDLEVVSENVTIVAAAERMRARRIGSVLVAPVEPGRETPPIVGIVTETDFVRKVIAEGLLAEETQVSQVMAGPLLTISPSRPILDASHLMEMNHVRHLCVSDGRSIVGLISVRDLVNYFVVAVTGPIRDLEDVYRPLTVLMRTAVEKIDGQESMFAAARRMAEKQIGSLLVTEAGEVTGIVTETDLARNALPYNLDSRVTRVDSIMNRPVIDIDINRTVHGASELMAEKGVRHLVVTENRKIMGILSVRDLIRMISVRDRPRFLAQSRNVPS